MTDGEALPAKVYGRDAADTRLVSKAWRFLAYKDSGPTLTITRLQQVEHEALCLYAARAMSTCRRRRWSSPGSRDRRRQFS